MDYEKAYKEALERAKKWYYDPNADKIPTYANKIISEIFPELKESEDEKIRKGLIQHLQELRKSHVNLMTKDTYDSWISWLEKQGKEEYALKSFKDEDVRKFMQYIEQEAKSYEFNLPNRGYDIYAFAKDILIWLEKQGEQKEVIKNK